MRLMIIILITFAPLTLIASSRMALKVAVLDTLVWEKLATEKYADNYKKGLVLAKDFASRQGIKVEYKFFSYSKESLAILKEVKNVKAWAPDVVIGPRFSSLFLLLSGHFRDTLVISPLATANNIRKMPKNFRSMSPPNNKSVSVMTKVVKKYYPGQTIHSIVEVDCKYCNDYANQFEKIYKDTGKISSSPRGNFLSKEVDVVRIESLVPHKSRDSIFLLPNRSYTSGTLMRRITSYLEKDGIVFIGADGWGDWSAGYTGKFKTKYKYTGLRITPWSLGKTDASTLRFHRLFKEKYLIPADGNISLITYKTMLSVIEALPDGLTNIDKRVMLVSYLNKIKENDQYGRPKTFGIYEVTQKGEKLLDIIFSDFGGADDKI
jgi:hypothetical protein